MRFYFVCYPDDVAKRIVLSHITHSCSKFFFSSAFVSVLVADHIVENETFMNFLLIKCKGWCRRQTFRVIRDYTLRKSNFGICFGLGHQGRNFCAEGLGITLKDELAKGIIDCVMGRS